MSVDKKIAWITGASGGIGAAIATQLASAGVDVGVCYNRNQAKAMEVVQQCRDNGVDAYAFKLDVTKEEDVKKVYKSIYFSLGKPTILVHAAGHTEVSLFQDSSTEQYHRLMDVHVKGAFLLARTTLPHQLQERWGRIIFVSSIWGSVGGATEVLYSTAKSALHGMTKALAKEVALSGITVNAVAPGAVDTKLLRQQLTKEEIQDLEEEIPVGRLGNPHEIASTVVFLCQQETSYITGQVIHQNGGLY
ncbi:3-oxoacyl-ACP reductase FabG [Shimazuella sp. AN120528]|uniref:elongation factor P 5-aminopentanone reductase n=1 Tax=Shimazuella soli TaxID=1892854 RepID=UPI001F0D12EC|nr:3-oxoacyl-ACP reductase FabG [Shimazuella soli]MCH5586435.1 3-oxoacyl-ACP reductase FabG [Shimazuella soli]